MSKIPLGSLDDVVTAGYQWSRKNPGTRVLAPVMPLSLDAWYRAMGLDRFLAGQPRKDHP